MKMHVKRIPGLLILSFSPAFCRKGVTSDAVNFLYRPIVDLKVFDFEGCL